ncbi:UDP-N-acetylglucosamine 1-carboxyvinyltransferase [Puniceicoccales bacterium CK1056]|uniref:UDP-N-acetylglucosamine 1-carboxyvinyltransferase n=1 Tax=Oceanipulchritudo coccoides TaxID=2706888 RepID=A0A6B2M555_9BACT|nr:UDP-N-acetylglucosamine 1-carboxyvinyltransferase [Oceanipulchritudo coccoides]NDV63516.1 UDP-N-acetylglucosamine 1-carboxyvinyltransferase [Oceanipulchritudo coccoides]
MDVFQIEGGHTLNGSVSVGGAKNAALPIFAATLLTGETCRIEAVPDLTDIRFMAKILRYLGARVDQTGPHSWEIEAKEVHHRAPYELVRQMRASVCLLGPLVGRLRRAEVSLPGGCVIGPRPIDLHLKGLSRLGCTIDVRNGYVEVDGSGLRGDYLYLGGRHGPTVTGTANMVMAAVLAPGVTRIESAACEPEVVDLCQMLVKMGAKIHGIGSHYLKIEGVKELKGCQHSVLPDRIEAGTLLIAGAMTHGEVTVENVVPGHMRALLDTLESCGVECEIFPDQRQITVKKNSGEYKPVEIITLPHPGFPTDLQAQMLALMSLTPGLSFITERIYPNRFMHVPELLRMGAHISMEGASAVVKGVDQLYGAPIMASDLRASAALVIAGLAAQGTTWIQRIYHLDRGYESLESKLNALGAKINRVDESLLPSELLEDA